ncbi:hypothetical protein ABZ746_23490 [Streptomyces sp. NPDC020096]
MITLASGSMVGTVLGSLGTGGGAALITAAILLGTGKKSKRTHKFGMAITLGVLAGALYAAAGFSAPAQIVQQVDDALQGIGIGLGAIAGILALWLYHGTHSPRRTAILGVWLFFTAVGAGGMWAVGGGLVTKLAVSLVH